MVISTNFHCQVNMSSPSCNTGVYTDDFLAPRDAKNLRFLYGFFMNPRFLLCKFLLVQQFYHCDWENHQSHGLLWSSLFYNTSTRNGLHKRDTSETRATQVQHEWKKIIFIFLHPYMSYMANERLQGEQQFHSIKFFWKISRSHTKISFKSSSQKLN